MSACPKPIRKDKAPRKPLKRTGKPRAQSRRPSSVRTRAKDAIWRRWVMCFAHGHCERCMWRGKYEDATDCHHVYGKKAHPALRFDTANGVAVSRACHRWAHAHPLEFRANFAIYRRMSDAYLLGRLQEKA